MATFGQRTVLSRGGRASASSERGARGQVGSGCEPRMVRVLRGSREGAQEMGAPNEGTTETEAVGPEPMVRLAVWLRMKGRVRGAHPGGGA